MSKQAVVDRIVELRAKGIAIAAICTRLGISRATYYRYIEKTAKV